MKNYFYLLMLGLSTVSFALNEHCTRYHRATNSYEHKYIRVYSESDKVDENGDSLEFQVNEVLQENKNADICMIRGIDDKNVEILLYIKKDNAE
ncbi:MAG: hypothetical protein RSB50_09430 [Cetobacterium sp.]